MAAKLGAFLREPLLHFAALGVLLFAADAAWGPERAPAPADTATPSRREPIVVDDRVRADLAATWRLSHAAPPTEAEMAALVEDWIREEILYREGLARGLDRGDPEIRDRIAAQMAYLLEARLPAAEPTEAELRAFFEAEPERWAKNELVDFVQVFVDGKDDAARARAEQLLQALQGGASPAGLGDTFSGGRRYRRRKIPDLAAHFGDAFVAGMNIQPLGVWALRESRFGLHLVRIEARSPAEAPAFEAVRDRVAHDLRRERRTDGLARAIAELRAGWEVAVEP